MARNAIVHRPRICLLHDIHLLNIAVAGLTRNIFIDVHAVVEVRIVGHFVYPFPRHQLSFVVVLCQSNDVRFVFPCNRMTVHARIQRRNHCVPRFRRAGMAILAVNPHRSCVQFMRIRNRLFRLVINAITFCAGDIICECQRGERYKENGRNTDLEKIIKKGFIHR